MGIYPSILPVFHECAKDIFDMGAFAERLNCCIHKFHGYTGYVELVSSRFDSVDGITCSLERRCVRYVTGIIIIDMQEYTNAATREKWGENTCTQTNH